MVSFGPSRDTNNTGTNGSEENQASNQLTQVYVENEHKNDAHVEKNALCSEGKWRHHSFPYTTASSSIFNRWTINQVKEQ